MRYEGVARCAKSIPSPVTALRSDRGAPKQRLYSLLYECAFSRSWTGVGWLTQDVLYANSAFLAGRSGSIYKADQRLIHFLDSYSKQSCALACFHHFRQESSALFYWTNMHFTGLTRRPELPSELAVLFSRLSRLRVNDLVLTSDLISSM